MIYGVKLTLNESQKIFDGKTCSWIKQENEELFKVFCFFR